MTAPTNGGITNSDDPLTEGDMQTVTCNSGYSLDGDATGTCTSGVWAPDITMTTCTRKFNVSDLIYCTLVLVAKKLRHCYGNVHFHWLTAVWQIFMHTFFI